MKTKLGKIEISKLKTAAGHSAAVLALLMASLISIPGLAQNFLFHLLGASEPTANFTTTSSTLSESAGATGLWPSTLNGWTARRPIVVDGVSASVSNFPLLLKIDSTKINYANTASLGADLRFADSSGNLLQYEIESWDTAGTSFVWVKLPTLNAEPARTVLWMYYGNSSATSAENAINVWSAAHSKVLHLNGAVGSIADGTAIPASVGLNAAASNAGGTGMAFASGAIGNGVQLDGGDDWISAGADGSLNFAASAPFTVSAYVKTTDSAGPLISFRDAASGFNVLGLYVGFNGATSFPGRMNVLMRDATGGTFAEIQGPVVNDGAWHHVAVTRNAGNLIELFVDGVSAGTASSGATGGAFTTDLRGIGVDRLWVIGGNNTADQRYLSGTVDEVRVSGVQHSSSYFMAQQLAYEDSLAYFLPEETPSQGTLPITVALNTPAISTVTIPYVVSGTATSGLDHNRASGNLVIVSGASSGSLDLQVLKDQVVEPDETAILTLGAATGATIGNDFVHTVTITDEALAPPVAVDDTVNVTTLSPITISVIANDTDANGDFLTISAVTAPLKGTAVRVGRTIRYTPSEDFSGVDSFTYTISDGRGGTDTADVTLNFQIPFTWTGLGADTNWSTAENWIGNAAPGAADTAYFNDQCAVSCNPVLAATLNVAGLRLNSSYSGTIAQNATVVTIGASGFRQRGGTFTGGTAGITVSNLFSVLGGNFQATSALLLLTRGDFSVIAPGVFTANNGTLQLSCVYGLTCNVTPGVSAYNDVVIGGSYSSYDLGGSTMVVAGNLSMGDSYGAGYTAQPVNNGTFLLSGNYSVINTGVRGSAVVKLVGNALGQQINGAAGLFLPSLTIASGTNQVTLNGEVNVANYYTYESGSVVTTGSTLWVHCEYGRTCPFTPGTIAYNNLRLSSHYGNYNLGGATVTVDGSLTIGDTYGASYLNQQLNNGTFNVSGNISISPFGYRGNAVLNSLGGNSLISSGATVGVPQGTFTVDKNAKTDVLTFGSNLSFSGTSQAVTLTEGTVDLSGFNLGVNGLLTVGANAKLECNGGTVTAGSVDILGEVSCGPSIGITWTGLGGNTLWSNPLNWTDNTVPTATDIAVFNSICGANCNATIDDNVNVRGIQMLQNYTGTITQGAGVTVAVGSAGWSVKAGTFTGSDANISITSSMSLYGGVFTAPSATLTLGLAECTGNKIVLWVNGGTFNHGGGRLKFNQGRPVGSSCSGNFTIAVPAGFTTYDLEFSANATAGGWISAVGYEAGFSSPIKVLRNFYDFGPSQNLHFDVEGDVYLENTNRPGTGILQLVGMGDQKINTTGATSTQLMRINKASGQVLPDTGVTNIWLYGLDLVQGSFSAPTGKLILGVSTSTSVSMNSLAIAAGTTFSTNGGTVQFALTRTASNNTTANVVVPVGFEFDNVEVTANVEGSGWTARVTSASTLVVAGNLVFGGNRNDANWHVRGNVSLTGSAPNSGTGSITLNGNTNQTLTGVSTAKSSNLIIASTGGVVTLAGTIILYANLTHSLGVVDPGTSTVIFGAFSATRSISPGTMSFNNVIFQGYTGTFNITGTVDVVGSTEIVGTSSSPPLAMNGGTVLGRGSISFNSNGASGTTVVKAGGSADQTVLGGVSASVPALAIDSSGGTVTLSGTLNIARGYEHINGVVNAGSSTIIFKANGATMAIVPGATLFNNVTFNGYVATFNLSGTLATSGTMNLASLSSSPAQSINTGTLNPQGALTFTNSGSAGTAPITFSGLTASAYTIGTSTQRPTGLVTADKSGGAAVNLASDVSLIGGGQDLLLNQGVLNLSGFDLYVIDGLTVAAGTTLRCSGGEFTSASLSNSGTIECPGYSTYPFNWTGNAADGNFATAGNWQGGVSPTASDVVVFNSAYCGANCNSTILANASVRGIQLEAGYLGTMTQNVGATLTVGSKGWRQSSGVFNGSNAAITIAGRFNLTNGTFNSTSGTLTLDRATTLISAAATFNHSNGLTVSRQYMGWGQIVHDFGGKSFNAFNFVGDGDVRLASALNVLGDLSVNVSAYSAEISGQINVGGAVTVAAHESAGRLAIRLNGAGDQLITTSGSLGANSTKFGRLILDKPSGSANFASSVVLYGVQNVSGSATFPPTSTVELAHYIVTDCWAVDTWTPGNIQFPNVRISGCGPRSISGTMTVSKNLRIDINSNAAGLRNGKILLNGDLTLTKDENYSSSTEIEFGGSEDSAIRSASGQIAPGSVTINKSGSGKVVLEDSFRVRNGSSDFTLTSGELDLNGKTLNVGNASGLDNALTIGPAGVLRINGGSYTSEVFTNNGVLIP